MTGAGATDGCSIKTRECTEEEAGFSRISLEQTALAGF